MTVNKHLTSNQLKVYLENKHDLPKVEVASVKKHIDNCKSCWSQWNKTRWDAALDSRGVSELKEYLGENFKKYHDSSWALAKEWYSKKPTTEQEVLDFYKETEQYVYNSLIFYESGDRKDFRPYFADLKNKYDLSSVIDYGCGIGNDGLHMFENGFNTYFADLQSPSTHFLKWRIENRKLASNPSSHIFNVENDVFPEVDMVWTIDALEHMLNPDDIFRAISDKTKLFVYFIDDDDQAGGRHPFHIPFNHQEFKKKLKTRGFILQQHECLTVWHRS